MRKSALIALMASLLVVAGDADAQVHFVIDPTLQWQGTGVQVNVGDCIKITASGLICVSTCPPSPQPDPTGCCPEFPDPCSCTGVAGGGYLVPGVTRYSLVGKIGAGAPFYIGVDLEMVSVDAGELFLAVNDDFYPDNDGHFDAWITSTPQCGAIPTLTEWGMIIFCVLLFGWMAWVIVRRRRRVHIAM
jgi:hypothetical protein